MSKSDFRSQHKPSILNPRTKSYEFSGPLGVFIIIITVPIIMYGLYFGCSEETGGCPPQGWVSSLTEMARVFSVREGLNKLADRLWDADAMQYYLAWYMFCVVSWAILPGATIEGKPLRNGEVKKYTANGEFFAVRLVQFSLLLTP